MKMAIGKCPMWLFVCGIIVSLVDVSHGHSWITCTDYLGENGEYWSADLCRAFPRHGEIYVPRTGTFGQDTGYDYNRPSDAQPCRTDRDDVNAYTTSHPMAVYYPGQRVVVTHPTKNHVADVRCTNKYIPDTGNRIYAGPRDAGSDVTMTEFMETLIADLGVAPVGYSIPDVVTTEYPKPGYQNAPKFCENTDKALATNTFVVPDLQEGRYTFLWGWWFNNEDDMYSSCWEVDIVASRQARDDILQSRGLSITDLGSGDVTVVETNDDSEDTPEEDPADGNQNTPEEDPTDDGTVNTPEDDLNGDDMEQENQEAGDTDSEDGSDDDDVDSADDEILCNCPCPNNASLQTFNTYILSLVIVCVALLQG